MTRVALCFAFSVWPLLGRAATQQNQGATILTQAVTVALGGSTVGTISDFTATGTITYYWGGGPVTGAATVRGLIPDQFRSDAVLTTGTQSYAVTGGAGQFLSAAGLLTTLPYQNTVSAGVLSFPFFTISTRLGDPFTTISFVGLTTDSTGAAANEVQVQRTFPPPGDPNGTLAALCVTDYYVNPVTGLTTEVVDSTHPAQTPTVSYSHEIDLQNYTVVNGVQVPMFVQEKINGQITWQLTISGISFNSGLNTADFILQ